MTSVVAGISITTRVAISRTRRPRNSIIASAYPAGMPASRVITSATNACSAELRSQSRIVSP